MGWKVHQVAIYLATYQICFNGNVYKKFYHKKLVFMVKSQMEFFLTSSLDWFVQTAKNLLRHEIMPKKRCKSFLCFGKGMYLTGLTLSGSGEISFPDILCPKNISSVALKTHLSLFSYKSYFRNRLRTCSVRISNWFRDDTHMMIGYSFPIHHHLLLPQWPVGKIHLHYVAHKLSA